MTTTTTIAAVEVFNRRTYKPCRLCAHPFARGSGCMCGGCGPRLERCPACGCPVDEPDNGVTADERTEK